MNINDSFEIAAEAFYKATGMLMPGKNIAAGAGWTEDQEKERKKLFGIWCAAIDYMKAARTELDDAKDLAIRGLEAEAARKDEALEHAEKAIKTAINADDGLDGLIGQAVINMIRAALSHDPSWLDEHDKRVLFEHADRNNCESARSEAVAIDDLPDREER